MESNPEHYLWVEKYRPKTVDDTILPPKTKDKFRKFVTDRNVPNLLLSGRPGIGKTTVAKAMLNELGADYITINASLDGNKATLGNDIRNFVSSMSLEGDGKRKYVILDEADHLTAAFQGGARAFMEDFSLNCGFILTCNYPNKIIDPIASRLSLVSFKCSRDEMADMAKQFYERCRLILDAEEVKYSKPVLLHFVKKFLPDWRKALNELQLYSVNGEIDEGILHATSESRLLELIPAMRARSINKVREWCNANYDIEPEEFFPAAYKLLAPAMTPNSVPALILTIGQYQHYSSLVPSQELNYLAFLTELMRDCTFND